jgi:hypothetical protein
MTRLVAEPKPRTAVGEIAHQPVQGRDRQCFRSAKHDGSRTCAWSSLFLLKLERLHSRRRLADQPPAEIPAMPRTALARRPRCIGAQWPRQNRPGIRPDGVALPSSRCRAARFGSSGAFGAQRNAQPGADVRNRPTESGSRDWAIRDEIDNVFMPFARDRENALRMSASAERGRGTRGIGQATPGTSRAPFISMGF